MDESELTIRPGEAADCAALLEIYRPYVVNSTVSFEMAPPDEAEFASRIERYARDWAWLVAERDGRPVAYAYGTPHRAREGYRLSTETSIYVASAAQRQGLGTRLYGELLSRLADRGYCNAFAGITLPNDASVALHARCGFELIGVFRRVGRKFGRWHDVQWMERRLRDTPLTEAD